ncbi:unnamed protein product, partial [Polarella glacialis]
MLKGWATRQLASALSDYLEGITPESVQTSLGRDIGVLNFRGARLNPKAVEKFDLELVRSELSVDASIPWRHLGSEPTVLAVQHLYLEVRLRPRNREKSAPSDRAERLAAKEAKVNCLEEESASRGKSGGGQFFSGSEAKVGRATRASHAILRQLRVTVGQVEALVHQEQAGPPLTLSIAESRFESVGPDWVSLPVESTEENEEDLRKVLRLSGLELRLAGEKPVFGPLAFEARLCHAPAKGLARVWIQVPEEAEAALRVDPDTLRHLRTTFTWFLAATAQQSEAGRDLSEAAGHQYAAQHLRKLRGEPYDKEVIAQIEEAANPEWLASWRCWCRAQLGTGRGALEPSAKPRPWRSFLAWASFSETSTAGDPTDASEPQALDAVDAFLEEAGHAGLLPELATPTRFRLDMVATRCSVFCTVAEQTMDATAGAICCVDIATAGSQDAAGALLRRMTLRLGLSSLSVRLDGQPLVELMDHSEQASGNLSRARFFSDEAGDEDVDAVAAGQAEASSMLSAGGLQLQFLAAERLSEAPGRSNSPWDLSVSIVGEPIRVQLAPWTIRGALSVMLEAGRAWVGGPAFSPPSRPDVGDEGFLSLPSEVDELAQTAWAHADASVFFDAQEVPTAPESSDDDLYGGLRLCLDIAVEAPIVRLEVPHGGSAIEMHFGCLRVVTTSSRAIDLPLATQSPTSTASAVSVRELQMPEACKVALDGLAFACELRQTRVAVVGIEGVERWVYEPSTLMVHFGVTPEQKIAGDCQNSTVNRFSCFRMCGAAGAVRCHLDPELLQLFGQLRLGLDYGFAPLLLASAELGSATTTDPNKLPESSKLPEPSGATVPQSRSQATWSLDLKANSFDLTWDPQSGKGKDRNHDTMLLARVGCVGMRLEKGIADAVTLDWDAQGLLMRCGDWELLKCADCLAVRLEKSSLARLRV